MDILECLVLFLKKFFQIGENWFPWTLALALAWALALALALAPALALALGGPWGALGGPGGPPWAPRALALALGLGLGPSFLGWPLGNLPFPVPSRPTLLVLPP